MFHRFSVLFSRFFCHCVSYGHIASQDLILAFRRLSIMLVQTVFFPSNPIRHRIAGSGQPIQVVTLTLISRAPW